MTTNGSIGTQIANLCARPLSRKAIGRALFAVLSDRVASGIDGVEPGSLWGAKSAQLALTGRLWREQARWQVKPLLPVAVTRGGKSRERAVPTLLDGVLLRARLTRLRELGVWDRIDARVVGGRPGADAPRLLRDEVWPMVTRLGFPLVVRLDVKEAFATAPLDLCLDLLAQRAPPEGREVVAQVEALYRVAARRFSGVPEGPCTSPLLLAALMDALVVPVLARWGAASWIWLDDVLVLVRQEHEADRVEDDVRAALRPVGMRLHTKPEKCLCVEGHERWDFLGFEIGPEGPSPSGSSKANLLAWVAEALASRDRDAPFAVMVGWSAFYARGMVWPTFDRQPYLALDADLRDRFPGLTAPMWISELVEDFAGQEAGANPRASRAGSELLRLRQGRSRTWVEKQESYWSEGLR